MATTTRPIKGAAAGVYADYLQHEERTLDYYSEGDGFDRVWGSLAPELGIERTLTREQWTRLYNGQHPDTGDLLVRKTDNRVPVMDFTLAAPKSVSELMVVADDELRERIKDAMWVAVREAFDYAEQTTVAARVRQKVLVGDHYESVQRRQPAKLLSTPVMQFCARATESTIERGAPPDPSLHCHVPVFTLAKVGDRFYTADNWGFKVNAEHVDAVFMNELARQLEALGIEIETNEFDRARNGKVRWEVKGSRKEARDHWSSNTERMWGIRRAFEEEFGKPIGELELRRRMYLTRKRKSGEDKEQDTKPVWERWREDAKAHHVPLIKVRQRDAIEHNPYVAATELRRRLVGPQGLARDGAVFDEEVVGQAIRRCAVGLGFSQEELGGLERIMLSDAGGDLILVEESTDLESAKYTTTTVLGAEIDIATIRDHKADRWVDITGRAGTGKSFAVGIAVEALRSQMPRHEVYEGKPVTIEASPIAEAVKAALAKREHNPDHEQMAAIDAMCEAAKGVEQIIVVSMAASTAERTGVKVKADTWGSVESIVSRIEKGTIKPTSRTLIVIEEAGQLDTLRAHKLLQAVGDARIVTLGDERQLSAIGAGGWYGDSLYRYRPVELTEVRRQKDQRDVADYALVRDGDAGKALANLDERGRVHVADSDADRMGQVFDHYRGHRETGRLARDVRIVLDSSNAEVDTANRFVQRDRLARGEISDYAIEVEQDETGRRWELHENDQVIMLSTVWGRGEDPVKNGTAGHIRKIEWDRNRVRVRLDGGREVNVPADASIGLAYAVHINKFQGGEVPIALCVTGRQTTRNSLYTELTRGIDESHIYVSEEQGGVEGLAKAAQRVDERESARKAIERSLAERVELPEVALDPIPELDAVDLRESWSGARERIELDIAEPEIAPNEIEQEWDFGQGFEL